MPLNYILIYEFCSGFLNGLCVFQVFLLAEVHINFWTLISSDKILLIRYESVKPASLYHNSLLKLPNLCKTLSFYKSKNTEMIQFVSHASFSSLRALEQTETTALGTMPDGLKIPWRISKSN